MTHASPSTPRHRKAALMIVITAMLGSSGSQARTLDDMFQSLGGYSNTGTPQQLEGQVNNYFTGGSYNLRVPKRNVQLATITPPSLRMGCGGIDLYAGSFSYVSSAEITALLRNIGAGVAAEAMMLALDTFVPVVGGVVKNVQKWAQDANKLTMDSCSIARGIVKTAGVTDFLQDSKQLLATKFNAGTGVATDHFDSAKQAQSGTVVDAATDQMKADPVLKEKVTEGNVVWKAVRTANFGLPSPAEEQAYKELLMSMLGTVVVTKTSVTPYQPIDISLDTFVGRNATGRASPRVYQCLDGAGEFECLQLVPTSGFPNTHDYGKSFYTLTQEKMTAVVAKLAVGQRVDAGQIDYMAKGEMPLYRLLVMAAAEPAIRNQLIDTAAELGAVDMAYYYVREAIQNVRDALTQKQAAVSGLDGETIGRILERGSTLLSRLDTERTNAYARVDQRNDAIGHLREYDRLMQTMGRGRIFAVTTRQN